MNPSPRDLRQAPSIRKPIGQPTGRDMSFISIKFTTEELELLAALASHQLFRREFIEPNMPGYNNNSEKLRLGKVLVERLRSALDPGSPKRTPPPGPVK